MYVWLSNVTPSVRTYGRKVLYMYDFPTSRLLLATTWKKLLCACVWISHRSMNTGRMLKIEYSSFLMMTNGVRHWLAMTLSHPRSRWCITLWSRSSEADSHSVEYSLQYSQKPANGPYPDSLERNPYHMFEPLYFFKIHFNFVCSSTTKTLKLFLSL
jgi:hypothetical protein